jgi:hypothetical protein
VLADLLVVVFLLVELSAAVFLVADVFASPLPAS